MYLIIFISHCVPKSKSKPIAIYCVVPSNTFCTNIFVDILCFLSQLYKFLDLKIFRKVIKKFNLLYIEFIAQLLCPSDWSEILFDLCSYEIVVEQTNTKFSPILRSDADCNSDWPKE